MTAIAAVLAFATPAAAQDATSPTSTTPVISVPDTAADPVLEVQPTPETAPVETAPVEAAPATDPLSATTAPTATPRATRTPRAATTARQTPRARTTTNTAPRVADPAPAPEAVASPIAPLAAAPLAVVPAPLAPPVEAPAPQPVEQITTNDMLPIAGAAGLGLLALLGAGAVVRRRKRRNEEADFEAYDEPNFERPQIQPAYPESAYPDPVREPALANALMPAATAVSPAAVAPAPAMASAAATPVGRKIDAPETKLPAGFDLSRFGPHVQAAYRGPTEDNPSLSLKNRLRRAGAMDQMEKASDAAPDAAPADAPVAASTDDGAVMNKVRSPSTGGFMLGNGATRPTVRPAYQN